jgi:hypothetical protein
MNFYDIVFTILIPIAWIPMFHWEIQYCPRGLSQGTNWEVHPLRNSPSSEKHAEDIHLDSSRDGTLPGCCAYETEQFYVDLAGFDGI